MRLFTFRQRFSRLPHASRMSESHVLSCTCWLPGALGKLHPLQKPNTIRFGHCGTQLTLTRQYIPICHQQELKILAMMSKSCHFYAAFNLSFRVEARWSTFARRNGACHLSAMLFSGQGETCRTIPVSN